MPSARTTPPWKKPTPRSGSTKLTAESLANAKARAKSAGRPYPNLVDNMWAAKEQEKTRRTPRRGQLPPD
jgi:hypothetical protein